MKCLVVLLLGVVALIQESNAQAEAGIKLKNGCAQGALEHLGYDTQKKFKKWQQKRERIIFDFDQLTVEPEKPTIPGCFNLTAKNVRITKKLNKLTAEFFMTIGQRVHHNVSEKLPCKQKTEAKCPCGAQDACMYCDFCSNFNNYKNPEGYDDSTGEYRTRKALMIEPAESPREGVSEACRCDIKPGIYDINAEICTPDREALEKVIPEVIFTYSEAKFDVTLWTTLYVYTNRFNDLNRYALKDPEKKRKTFQRIKKAHLGGCAIIGTDLTFA